MAKRRRRHSVTITYADGSVRVVGQGAITGHGKKRVGAPGGGRKQRYEAYINSPGWKALAGRVRQRDKHRCVRCGGTDQLEVHHLHYRRFGHERIEDLTTLCHDCHQDTHRALRARRQRKKNQR